MKKFLIKTALFLLPIIILAFPIDYFLSTNLKKTRSYIADEYSVWNEIYASNIDAEIAVYGSSRAWQHINSEILEDSMKKKSYNFGINGHNFWLQYLRHKELLKYNNAPKYIVYSLDIFTLQKRPDLYHLEQFLPYMLYDQAIENYTISYQGFDIYDYYIPLLRYSQKLGALHLIFNNVFLLNSPNTCSWKRQKGFYAHDASWGDDLEEARKTMNFYEAKVDSASVKLFDTFLYDCKKNDIKVIFVYTPEYIDGQEFMKNRQEIMDNYYQYFANKYNLPFLDYSNDEMCYEQKYFYNALHLNAAGADIFTKKLAHDLKKMNLVRIDE